MAARLGDDGKWGWQIDFNFFACSKEAMLQYTKNGCDRNSLCGCTMVYTSRFQSEGDHPRMLIVPLS